MPRLLQAEAHARPCLHTCLLLLLAAFAALSAAACSRAGSATADPQIGTDVTPIAAATPSPAATEAPQGGKRGGTLRIAQAEDPASCDLHMSRGMGYQSVHACNPMLSQLVRAPANDYSLIEPDLAMEWGTSTDGLVWTFILRDGVTWHDGSPVTAGDVVFSLRRVLAPPDGLAVGRAGVLASYVGNISQIASPRPGVVTVRTDFTAASFLPNLASVYLSIYPRAVTEALDPPSMVQFESVVGSGPFKAGEVVRGSSFTLDRNEAYYEPGLPYLDAARFLVMPEPAVRMTALWTHAVDAIAIVTEPEAAALERDFAGRIHVFTSPSAGGNSVQMNLRRPPFDDPRLRRAVNLAMSRQDADLALGTGYAGAVLPPGGAWGMAEDEVRALPGYRDKATEREEARRLLAGAGFEQGLEVRLITRANPFFETLAAFAAGQLETIGIRATVTPMEPVAYQDALVNGEFEIAAHSHSFALDDPDAILRDHYGCDGAENFPGLCDAELDAMISRQSRTLDRDERAALLEEIERRIWDTDAKVWLQWSSRRAPVWSNVHGMEPGGPSLYQGRRLERVWLE